MTVDRADPAPGPDRSDRSDTARPPQPTRPPRPTTARGRRTREIMVDTAAGLMQARGIAATSVGDVLTASGTGKSQLYHHFGGKDGLVRAVLDHQLDRVLAAQPELGPDGQGDVVGWAQAILAAHRAPGGPFSCPLGVFSGQVDDDPGLRAHHAAAFETWRQRIAAMLVEARRRGRVAATGDPDELAAAVLATLQGGLMLARLHRDIAHLEAALRCALDHVRAHPASLATDPP